MTPSSTLVWRLRGRHQIEATRRARRSASGPVWVRFAPGLGTTPPEVGYAVGRAAGGAVARNRLRRRLRAVIAELAPSMSPGTYLVGASGAATTLGFSQLTEAVWGALAAAGALAAEEQP